VQEAKDLSISGERSTYLKEGPMAAMEAEEGILFCGATPSYGHCYTSNTANM
jgi:hypothetical protein